MRWAISAALLSAQPGRAAQQAFDYCRDSRQMILVEAEGPGSFSAKVSLLDRSETGWTPAVRDLPAVIGKKGLALGRGLEDAELAALPLDRKKEGDLKSPVGVFRLGRAYGYSAEPPAGMKLEYTQLLESHQGVDDPASKYYNQIVDTRSIDGGGRGLWKSHEVMRRKDDLYKWLVVVLHNDANVPGQGSLIFLHVWRGPGFGTAGCTAMAEENILKVLRWLDPAKNPVLALVPRSSAEDWLKRCSHPRPTPERSPKSPVGTTGQ